MHGTTTVIAPGAPFATVDLSRIMARFLRWSLLDTARALANLAGIAAAVVVAYLVRFDWFLDAGELASLHDSLAILVPAQGGFLLLADVHRRSIRGLTRSDLWRLVQGVSGGTVVAVAVAAIAGVTVPRSILLAQWFFAISMLGGLRALACEIHEALRLRAATGMTRCLLVGTCPSSEAIVRTINGGDSDRRIVGLAAAAENAHLVGRTTLGVPVLDTVERLEQLIAAHGIEEVMLVSGTLVGRQVRGIERRCAAAGCRVRIIPVIETLVSGGLHVQPRPLDIADLLKREAVDIDLAGIGSWLGGATVLVTGAAGSIGSEICRQVATHAPGRLLLVDRNENGLFWLERELHRSRPGVDVVPCVADITDETRIEAVMAEHRPTIVFHAAAYKHVPLMEAHPGEAVKNIALASAALARAAAAADVETFVMISTDKAVNPTSVMGSCKRIAEQLVLATGVESATKFVAVRFGNVLDSAGSVVPLFREQILQGGPVTVTHPDIERFFMTIPEASRLVLQAGLMGQGGEVFVLDMGEPVRIAELARDMIRLSGLVEGRDIEIQYTGLRPGEKLFEELWDEAGESLDGTAHPKILAIHPESLGGFAGSEVVDLLRGVADEAPDIVRHTLATLVPGCAVSPTGAVAGRIGPGTLPRSGRSTSGTLRPRIAA